jgi:hypothetical protein
MEYLAGGVDAEAHDRGPAAQNCPTARTGSSDL